MGSISISRAASAGSARPARGEDVDGRGHALSKTASGRLGAALLGWLGITCVVASAYGSGTFAIGAERRPLLQLGIALAGAGALGSFVPWRRLPRPASLVTLPAVCTGIGLTLSYDGALAPLTTGVAIAVAAWAGLGHRRGTPLLAMLLVAAALGVPVRQSTDPATWWRIGAAAVACVAVGETAAWATKSQRRRARRRTNDGRSTARTAASHASVGSLVERAGDLVTLLDTELDILYENPALFTTLGYAPDARVGSGFADYVHPDDRPRLGELVLTLIGRPGRIERTELRIRHADGTDRWCALSFRNLAADGAEGRDGNLMVICVDISARRDEHADLERRETDFRQLFESSPQLLFVYDRVTHEILEANRSATEHYGYSRRELLAMTVTDLFAPHEQTRISDLDRGDRGGSAPEVWRHVRRDNGTMEVELATHLVGFDGRDAVLLAVTDVTAQRALEQQLVSQAFQDPLTGLPNRALFKERIQHALVGRTSGEASVLFIDLDRFKTVNDSLGHGAGDELLVAVAKRIGKVLRAEDTLARLGGDEFAVLVERANGGGEVAGQRVLDALRRPFAVGGAEVQVAASIGIASAISGNADDLLRNADTAMYRAKAGGRNRYEMYNPQMQQNAKARLRLETDLGGAIERDEMRVVYQPVVELGSEVVVGAEALLRWEHPDIGTISPAKFVPIAEESGFIVPLGRWVLAEACRHVSAWHLANPDRPPLSVAVNVSVRQLQESHFVDDVEDVLRECGLAPHRLTLEITETVLMEETETIVHRLDQLKELGVRIAIDDFGTGYSSLAYLSQLPVDVLKIDRTFTAMIERLEDVPPLVEGLVHLGKQLRLEMVAEGIEDREQLDCLRSLGCSHGQGFIWSRPVEWSAFEATLERPRLSSAAFGATAVATTPSHGSGPAALPAAIPAAGRSAGPAADPVTVRPSAPLATALATPASSPVSPASPVGTA